MGQSLDSMTQQRRQQSNGELLYHCVCNSNIDAIKAIHLKGASLEWIDRDGKTPLIVTCLDSGLITVAKTLIELGANINAYRPGRHGGTPLHHAAKRGLEPTVKLLLSYGANALAQNDDCQTALDVARAKGSTNVVRAIECHICYFSGWLQEFYGPGFLEGLATRLLSRKVWVVVLPCGSSNPRKPQRFELAMYSTLQDSLPHTVVALSKAIVEKPKFHQPDPVLTILDHTKKVQCKLASANEGDKQQLQQLYNACRGIPLVTPSTVPHNSLITESYENTNAVNANGWETSSSSVQTCNGWGPAVACSEASSSGWMDNKAAKDDYNGWDLGLPGLTPVDKRTQNIQSRPNTAPVNQTISGVPVLVSSAPSAPPIPEEISGEGPIYYPPVDNSPTTDWDGPPLENRVPVTDEVKDEGASSSCVICWEAPIEGACIPCGHMAGCMSCLNEIKAKKGVCPVCRSKINQVIRLYAV